MFHFPGCPPVRLWIHLTVTGHYPGRVPPFGYPGINAYLQLPQAFRSLSRPSSAISALASTLRSYSLDLASTLSQHFSRMSFAMPALLRLLRGTHDLICVASQLPLLTGIFRFRRFASECLPCAVFKVRSRPSLGIKKCLATLFRL